MRFLPLLFLQLFLATATGFGQGLLLNGDFEEENICTEFKLNCSPEAWIGTLNGVFNYFKDANRAHSGTHCFAIEAGRTGFPYWRTYVRNRLLCGLRKGQLYRLTLYVKSPHDILDSIGVIFSDSDPLYYRIMRWRPTASMYFSEGSSRFAKKDTNWQRVTLEYRATGNEVFCIVGNFASRDISGETGIKKVSRFFVFLDDISLVPVDENEKLCANWEKVKEEIYAQDERHEFMQRMINAYQRNNRIPEKPVLMQTSALVVDTLVLPDILFATGMATLQPNGVRALDSICSLISKKQIDSIAVKGHTDNTGISSANQVLSEERARTVAGYLAAHISQGAVPFTLRGLADLQPVASNETAAGRQKNRRVEILVYARE